MIEVVLNDRLGKKVRGLEKKPAMAIEAARVKWWLRAGCDQHQHAGGGRPARPPTAALQIRVKCNEDDTIGDLKKLVAAQTGAEWVASLPLRLPGCCWEECGAAARPAAAGCTAATAPLSLHEKHHQGRSSSRFAP